MYDNIAVLMSEPVASYDAYGNEELTYTENEIYVNPRGVYQSEFYNAAQLGLQPSITLELTNRADYNGEKLVRFEDELYNVIRADWTAQRDKISLVCEKRVEPDGD